MLDWFFSRIFTFISVAVFIGIGMQFYYEGAGPVSFFVLFLGVLMVGGFLYLELKYLRPPFEYERRYKKLKAAGDLITVKIRRADRTDAYINNMPVMTVSVAYRYNNKQYSETLKLVVDYTELPSFRVGGTKKAWVDKRDPRKIVFS